MTEGQPAARPWPASGHDLAPLLARVARGDQAAFATVYDHSAAQVFGLVRRVVRDPAQSEEVTQEVMLEVWRTASRFDPHRGSAMAWLMTMAHRRAVDRVRSGLAAAEREARAAVAVTDYDVPRLHRQLREAVPEYKPVDGAVVVQLPIGRRSLAT